MADTTGRRRAPGMAPDERRAMIVAAALPLVAEYGTAVTTAKIARAAGIGEATIFRVFEDKEALLAACVAEALRPDELLAGLSAISLEQPLAERLTEALDAMRGHLDRIGAVIGALHATGYQRGRGAYGQAGTPGTERMAGTPGPDGTPRPDGTAGAAGTDGAPMSREDAMAAPRAAVAGLFAPERERLRMAPEVLAEVFLALGRVSVPGEAGLVKTRELVDLFLYGALAPAGSAE
ncbi:TetR/AcrR family transcriptional regulator [Streptomyces sp. MST-110588]|uniref:TetR/AcrR family transcriptional regulator n=1 Tax=Streptomyces sp. MST-110588 TaxID=2833628 RepID=UPI001F5D43D2|nr:TetR/AcrR family transcriptional regulator [Streptomyces sp. MST-110588]UNO40898.1 TetR/AcrR family transcriptional regulator [Streptomyces sp. MST-110588]